MSASQQILIKISDYNKILANDKLQVFHQYFSEKKKILTEQFHQIFLQNLKNVLNANEPIVSNLSQD